MSRALLLAALSGCTASIGDAPAPGVAPGSSAMPGGATTRDPGDPGDPRVPAAPSDPRMPGATVPPPPAPDTPAFRCAPGAAGRELPWRRLTKRRHENTLRDLLAFGLGDAEGAATMRALANTLAAVPEEEREKTAEDEHGTYRRLDQDLQQQFVDATYDVAVRVGAEVTMPQRLGTLLGACATNADTRDDGACLTDFLDRFASRALRRPVTADEIAAFKSFSTSASPVDPRGVARVVAGVLAAPQFLYLVEHGAGAIAGQPDVHALTPFELAARLSYHFWDTLPDEALWQAARSGALLTRDGLAAQVTRLARDTRARPSTREFFREWLKLEEVSPLGELNQTPAYKTFAGTDLPTSRLRDGIVNDALAMAEHHAFRPGGTLRELLTAELSFAASPEVARLYGVPAWTGGDPVPLPAGQRPGLLTRAAFLVNGSGKTRPVMKGVFIRRTILCDELPPPPADVDVKEPSVGATMTTRQIVEAVTEQAGSACAACHKTLINPLGFPFEAYDALGRFRTEERIISATGTVTARMPIDTRSVPQVRAGDLTPVDGPAELVARIASSGKAEACLARQYFRYAFARWEDPAADGCVLEALRQALTAPQGGLTAMFEAAALAPTFQQRSFR